MNRSELVEYIVTGPPRMNEAGWYLLLGFFIIGLNCFGRIGGSGSGFLFFRDNFPMLGTKFREGVYRFIVFEKGYFGLLLFSHSCIVRGLRLRRLLLLDDE